MNQKEYYQANKDRWRKYYAEAKQDPTFLERKNNSVKAYYARLKDKVYDKLGRVCAHCGFSDERALQIDHVNGCGYEERKRCKSGAYLRRVLEDTEGKYQILCANCNWIKKADSELENSSIYTPKLRAELKEGLV